MNFYFDIFAKDAIIDWNVCDIVVGFEGENKSDNNYSVRESLSYRSDSLFAYCPMYAHTN